MNHLGARRLDTGGRLALEWTRLRTHPGCLATASGWGLLPSPVTDLAELLTAVGYERPHDADSDDRFRALVLLAATDDLAARIVLQRLLPGLLAVVRRRRGRGEHVFEELLGAAWIAIRTFNPARHPRGLAAALISDADYAAFRAAERRRSSDEVPVDVTLHHVADDRAPSPCDELAEIIAEAARSGIASDDDLLLIRRLAAGASTEQLAESMQVTSRTIRNRRARITSALRGTALAA